MRRKRCGKSNILQFKFVGTQDKQADCIKHIHHSFCKKLYRFSGVLFTQKKTVSRSLEGKCKMLCSFSFLEHQ